MSRPRRAKRPSAGEPTQRQRRVGELLRHALIDVLRRDVVRDPDVAGIPITVTEVRVSPDLRAATAFIVPLGGGAADQICAGLGRAAPFLRREVAGAVDLRYMPALEFALDTSFDEAARIESLLHTGTVARDLAAPADDESDGGPDGA